MNLLIAFSVTCTMLILTACAGLPTESQTGRTAIVRVLDGEVLPRDITVQPGDAVELLNARDRPVWIYFGRDRLKELSCQRGFSFFWGLKKWRRSGRESLPVSVSHRRANMDIGCNQNRLCKVGRGWAS